MNGLQAERAVPVDISWRYFPSSTAVVRFYLPVFVFLTGMWLTRAFLPGGTVAIAFSMGYFFIPVVGAVASPVAAVAAGVPWWVFLLFSMFASACGAAFIAYNFDWLNRFPWLGAKILSLEAAAKSVLAARRWLRAMEFFGLILFVALPITGSTAPVGVVLGRIFGMSARRTFCAVWFGSALQIIWITASVYGLLVGIRS